MLYLLPRSRHSFWKTAGVLYPPPPPPLQFPYLCLLLQGRLNELMSQIRMQNHFGAVRSEERYSVDADLLREIKHVSADIHTMHPIVTSECTVL